MTPRRLILDVVAPRGAPSTARASTSARASTVVSAVPRACPHFPACSGCVTALDAVDALDPPVLEAVREYFGDDAHETFRGRATRWRCKAKLAARAETSSGRVALGLFKRGTHELAATETCPVSHVGVERAAATTRATCDALGVTPYDESTGKGELRYVQTVMCSDEAVDPGMDEDARAAISLVFNANTLTRRHEEICMDIARRGGDFVRGVSVNLQDARSNVIFNHAGWVHVYGEYMTFLRTPSGQRVYYLPGSFMQANSEAYGELLRRMPRHVPRGSRVVEMFSGVGAIGFSLLTNVELDVRSVRFVESSSSVAEAWERTRDELPNDSLKSRVSLQIAKAEKIAVESTRDCDVLVVDPPRKGLDESLRRVLTDSTLSDDLATILYVSCGFDSFKRDADELVASGMWTLTHHESFVFFPATNHIEVFAVFKRSKTIGRKRNG